MMTRLLTLVGLTCCIAPVWADFAAGTTAFENADYEEAARQWRPLAEQGSAEAQLQLGMLYDTGSGVDRNLTTAVAWYRKAAEQNMADAQSALAFMYRHGNGVPRDYGEAAKWYRKAADRGIGTAQFDLGGMYFRGRGVEKDLQEAYKWLTLAAMNGIDVAPKALFQCVDRMTLEEIALAQARADEWNLIQE